MNPHDAIEQAYRNGYDAGYKAAKDEIVRCKDCKYYKPGKHFEDINFCYRLPYYAERGGLNTSDDDFCSRGERKEDV
jgi:hypothetical protein